MKHELWGQGVRWDWDPEVQGLVQRDRVYRNEFRTLPDPLQPLAGPFSFIVIGDFGVGIRKRSNEKKRQLEVAQALERAVDEYDVRVILTTGDNIYAAEALHALDRGLRRRRRRLVLHLLPAVPLRAEPRARSARRSATTTREETEEHDDRDQVMDNMYLRERLAGEEAAGRASLSPGLFYKFRASADIEFVCIDTSKESFFRRGRIFEYPKHWEFMQSAFPPAAEDPVRWRIPFGHHPPFSAGPQHHNTRGMRPVIDLFERSGVRVSFSGHEHNFQHSHWNGIDYFVSGAGAKIRRRIPDDFERRAHAELVGRMPFSPGNDRRRPHDRPRDR